MKITIPCTLLFVFLFWSSAGLAQSNRDIEGFANNVLFPEWGSSGDVLYKISDASFGDGISSMNGEQRPNPRVISNLLFTQEELIFDVQDLSDFVWVFGQFIDHDIVLVDNELTEPLFIAIPSDDPVFSPEGAPIGMFRSKAVADTGTDLDNKRKYANEITAYLDGSAVYGSTLERANWLRSFQDGKLKTSSGNLLPWNTSSGEFNDRRDSGSPFMDDPVQSSSRLFVAGDIRANENPLLLTIHTLFVRDHNRLCDQIMVENPAWDDEQIYQKARKLIGAIIQSITYNEWLPEMGINLPSYSGYRDNVNAQISNVFSAAAFRMGHTLINSNIIRLKDSGEEISNGHIGLKDAFFNPLAITLAGGIDPYLRGMATQLQQKLDCKVIDDVRNFLFGPPSAGGLDLAAININRGRERGLADFNGIRTDIGLPKYRTFEEISVDNQVITLLKELYDNPDNIDPWVGMLAEDVMPRAMFGPTIKSILEDQFERLRDGDIYYFENDPALSTDEKNIIRNTSLRDVIMRNTDITLMQENVFKAKDRNDISQGPDIAQIDFEVLAYPNPTLDDFHLKLHSTVSGQAEIDIFDNRGSLAATFTANLEEGDNTIPLSLQNAASGQYYNVRIRRSLNQTVLRVFKP